VNAKNSITYLIEKKSPTRRPRSHHWTPESRRLDPPDIGVLSPAFCRSGALVLAGACLSHSDVVSEKYRANSRTFSGEPQFL